jgi:sterol O-acyltransferase
MFSTVSGIVCLLTLFYGILHTWFNIFAELLRFGDRLFYEDWWNVTNFAEYYRKWNIVVHEFLYYYIY